jgi:hypothetical protein
VIPARCYGHTIGNRGRDGCGWHGFEDPGAIRKCPACAGLLVPVVEPFEVLEAIRAHVGRELGDGYEVVGVTVPRLARFRLETRVIGVDAVGPVEVSTRELERISPTLLASIVAMCRHRGEAARAELVA